MKRKQLTPAEYADKRGISLSAVTAHIRRCVESNCITMPFVNKIDKIGRFYLLHVKLNNKGELI